MTTVVHVPVVAWEPTEAIARSVTALAQHLDGVTSHLVTNGTAVAAGAFAGVHRVPGWPGRLPLSSSFADVVAAVRPDVVHLHGGALTPLLSTARALRGHVVVATCYSAGELGSLRRVARRAGEYHSSSAGLGRALASLGGGARLARRMLRLGRTAVVCTPDDDVADWFGGAGPVVRVRGAAQSTGRRACWSEQPTVVFAGRAERGRGVDDLIAAFPRVRDAVPGARLRLVLLPGADASRWQHRLRDEPWAEVSVGAVDDLDAVFASAQVAAFPFRWPATVTPALAAAEAMAAGLPLVATDVGCLRPLVRPGRDGAIVPPADPGALAAALVDLLYDRERWEGASSAARDAIAADWSWGGAARQTLRAYEVATARAAATPARPVPAVIGEEAR